MLWYPHDEIIKDNRLVDDVTKKTGKIVVIEPYLKGPKRNEIEVKPKTISKRTGSECNIQQNITVPL